MKKYPHEKVISGLFTSREQVHRALDALAKEEVSTEDISVITNRADFEEEEFSEVAGMKIHDESLHAGKVGMILGGIGSFVTAVIGMWMSQANALAAAPVVLLITIFGGLLGAYIGTGFRENEVAPLDRAIDQGKIILAVHNPKHALTHRIESIMKDCQGEFVHSY